jgi:Ca-activated chloride channel family protein
MLTMRITHNAGAALAFPCCDLLPRIIPAVFSWPEFEEPAWLLLLPAVPILVGWWALRKSAALRFSDTRGLRAINSRRGFIARWCGALVRVLALAAMLIALAGPRWPDPGNRLPTEGIAVLLVVDFSGSMNEPDFVWRDKPITRWKAMQHGFRLFITGGQGPHGETLPGRSNDLFGLVVFAEHPRTACPLTLSHDTLLQLFDREEPGKGGNDPATNIGDAIAWGVHRLNASPMRQKVMVLVTDGEHNVDTPALRPKKAAQLAGHFGIPIYIVDAGPEVVTLGQPADQQKANKNRQDARKEMQDVAKITGGQYFPATDGKGLLEAYGKLNEELDRRDREQIETYRYRHYREGFAWFATAGLMLLVVLLGLELTVWRRFP